VARQHGWVPMQVVVTTNYDDLLERAYRAAGEEFDVLTYLATEGKFVHIPPDGEPRVIERGAANSYLLPQDARRNLIRPAIIKLHGAVDRVERSRDSFVISEDHYIDFLSRFNAQDLVPAPILAKLAESNFLFLGYSLRDWNLRVILYRLWREQRLGSQSWAIQRHPMSFERKFWSLRRVELLDIDLDEYIQRLAHAVGDNGRAG
jgi:SIR2-like domain